MQQKLFQPFGAQRGYNSDDCCKPILCSSLIFPNFGVFFPLRHIEDEVIT